ncbi:hypothetical protein, partial [Rhodovulum sp.]|uniref:hypothetical protein n=1 Tax=Rhodovulum sp. TaxID=34009 RepID=UPI00257BF69B
MADEAWKSVATTIRAGGMPRDDNDVADTATGVAFTERLLRELLPLEPGAVIRLLFAIFWPGSSGSSSRKRRAVNGAVAPMMGAASY